MEINSKLQSVDPSLKKQKFNEDATKPKTTKEVQEDVKIQIATKKVKEEEKKDVEDIQKSDEIRKEISELVTKLNQEMSPLSRDVKFGYNEDIGQLMVNVIDANTGDIIRQMPSEEAIKIMTKMKELIGMLFDKKG